MNRSRNIKQTWTGAGPVFGLKPMIKADSVRIRWLKPVRIKRYFWTIWMIHRICSKLIYGKVPFKPNAALRLADWSVLICSAVVWLNSHKLSCKVTFAFTFYIQMLAEIVLNKNCFLWTRSVCLIDIVLEFKLETFY